MRWSRILAGAVLALVFATAPVMAQDGGNFGIGIGVSSSLIGEVTNLLTPTVYVPIMATDQLMIEPSIGLVRTDNGDSDTLLSLQAGILFMIAGNGDSRVYVGPRAGILDSSDSDSNLTLAGVLGGEAFIGDLVSLGGEAGLRYLDADGGSLLTTLAEFRVRWYFGQ